MRQISTFSFFSKRISLLIGMCLMLMSLQSVAQVTATEDFENETGASSFSESGINFTHTFLFRQNNAPYGYNGSAKFLELANNTQNLNTVSASISINNSQNPSVSYKINSFAAYVSAGGAGATPYNGEITVTGTPVGSSTAVSATISIASASGSLPAGQSRDANGTVNGLNFTGTPLAGLYFTSLTFSVTDNNINDGTVGTRYLELDHINFTSLPPSSNQFSIADANITEGSAGTKLMTFTVSCTSTSAASSVQVQSSNGTATAGSDYVAFPLTTISFVAGGTTSQTVNVTINGDMTIEPDETFNMTLSNPVGGTIFDGTAVGTILDDDNITETFEDEPAIPVSSISTVTGFSERGFNFVSNGELFVSRGNNLGAGGSGGTSTALDTRTGNGGSTGNVGSFSINSAGTSFNLRSIDVYTSNNDGNTGTTGNVNVTFTGAKADGSGTVSYTATIATIVGDNYQTVNFTGTAFENVQILSVSVTLGTGINYVALDNIRYGTISFSGVQLSINDVSVLEGTGGGTSTATFTVTRSGNSSSFSVNVATSNISATAGSDYVAYNATLNFAAGGPLTQTVPITILRDAVIESNETFNVTLSGATNGVLYQKAVGLGTILDDDKVIENFEDETNGAATFSENSIGFSATNRLKVVYNSGAGNGSGSSKGYLSSGDNASGGTVGKITITNPNMGFKLLQLDMLTYKGISTSASIASGPVTFNGTLFDGSTVTTTKTITPTSLTGTGFQQNITFTGTPLDNVILTSLEFVAGGTITTIDIDNINYVAVTTVPYTEITDAANHTLTNGAAASSATTTDFGSICISPFSVSVSNTFTIKNTGAVNLAFSGSPVAVLGGPDASQFSITSQPAATVAANSSTTFTVKYAPTAIGIHNATVTLTSNDASNSPYVINIKGTANATATPTATVIQPTCTVATGSITVNSPSGANITYSIDGINYQVSNVFSNVAPGNYNVTAKNSSGCTSAATPVTINAAPAVPATPTVTVTQPSCSFATGTITVNTPTGANITYSIDGTNYQTGNVFTNVAPGNYNVTAKNSSSGCVSSALSITINPQPAVPATPTVTVTQPSCTVATGTITVNTPTGANITYSIDGTNYQASNIFNNVAPGNYSITAKNTGSGCVSSALSVTINPQPASPATPTVTVSQPTCSTPTGTITVNTPTGSGIAYSIDNTSYQTGNVFSNLAPGNYNVTARNSSNCTSAATLVTINPQPASPATPTVTVTQPTCAVGTGTITVNMPGGAGITYSIDGTTYQSSNIFSNVAPGNYSVTARNSSNCTSAATPVTINAQPATPATPTVSVTQPTCAVATGTITVNTPTGAGITYSIDGTNYQSSNIFSNVVPGNYSVTARYSSNCTSAATPVTINAGPAVPAAPTVSTTQPTCSVSTGTITVNSPSGTGITYSINGTTYQASNVFNNVAPGNYSVTARNSSNCTSAATPVTINPQPATPATLTVTVNQPTCPGASGTITVNTPTGAGITYSINGTTYQAGNVFNNVAPGTYSVTARSSSGCVSTATPVTINAGPADTQAPTIVLKSNPTVFLTAANTYTVQLSDVLQSVGDNCDPNPSATVSTVQVTCNNLGSGSGSGIPHQAYVSNTTVGNANYDGQFGMTFKVNSASGVVIDKLGAFDDQSNGTGISGNQSGGVRVAIFNQSTQAIVPGLDVTISGATDPLVGNYRMRSISPVTLAPGNYVIITKGYVGEKFYNRNQAGPLNPAGDNAGGVLTFLNTVYYGTAPAFGFPDNAANAGNPNEYISGTFNYALSASNNVTITATDVAGNMSTATATVTVIDTFYVLTTKTATVNLNASGQATIAAADVLQSLKNNCGVDVTSSTFQVSPSSFTCADISSGGVTPSADNHQAYISNTAVGNANYDGQFGMSFKVNDANGVSIDKLGAFDDQGNGITGSQGGGVRVAIFNIATQAIVSGLDVTISGTTDPLVGSYRMRSITPVTLAPGNYAIITKGYVGEKFYNRNQTGALNPVGDNAGGALSFLNTVYYGNVAAFGFPDNAANAGNPNEYISGTFNYKTLVTTGTTVTLTATDVYGNKKQATAQVVVKDVSGPTVITKNITLNLNSSGMASITANDVLQTPVTDNCGVQSVTVSPNNFTCADYSGSGNNGTPHQAYISNTAVGNASYDGQFGMSFKVNSANGVVIDKLGAFDDQGNGITGNQGGGVRVAIFNIATQAIVSGLDVTISGTTDPLVGSYRMRSITPVTLPAGNYVIITKGYVGEKFYNRNQTGPLNPVGDNAGGALTFLNTVYYGNAAAFGFPNNSGDAGNPNEYISGTFNYALNVSNNKIVTVTATDTHGNVTTATATVTLTNTSNSCATPAPVMAYAARNVQTEAPVVLDNVSMTVKVYPNPSSGQFTVQLYNLKATKVSLQVMDANGQVVVQREASLSSKTPVLSIPVDISKHASGIYLIKVISADGVQTAKVVVSK